MLTCTLLGTAQQRASYQQVGAHQVCVWQTFHLTLAGALTDPGSLVLRSALSDCSSELTHSSEVVYVSGTTEQAIRSATVADPAGEPPHR